MKLGLFSVEICCCEGLFIRLLIEQKNLKDLIKYYQKNFRANSCLATEAPHYSPDFVSMGSFAIKQQLKIQNDEKI